VPDPITRERAEDLPRAADFVCCGLAKNAPAAQLDKAPDLPWELGMLFQFDLHAQQHSSGNDAANIVKCFVPALPIYWRRRPLTYVNGE